MGIKFLILTIFSSFCFLLNAQTSERLLDLKFIDLSNGIKIPVGKVVSYTSKSNYEYEVGGVINVLKPCSNFSGVVYESDSSGVLVRSNDYSKFIHVYKNESNNKESTVDETFSNMELIIKKIIIEGDERMGYKVNIRAFNVTTKVIYNIYDIEGCIKNGEIK